MDSSQREPQNLRWAGWCDQGGGAGSDHQIPERCDHCGDPNVKTEQFLEPAGFRVDWNAQPHADTEQAVYIEPKSPKASAGDALWQPLRTEEHTSELQPIRRNSYAVCCLKKKQHYKIIITTTKYVYYYMMSTI